MNSPKNEVFKGETLDGEELKGNMLEKRALKTSMDSFHFGGFFAVQPVSTGHRAGQDALFLAACLKCEAKGKLADLGAGCGVAGLAAASQNAGLEVTLIEKDPVMAELARQSAELQENAHFSEQVKVLEADVTLRGEARVSSGLHDNNFDYVIMNPPYNHPGQRASPDQLKKKAHAISDEGLLPWVRTAAAIIRPSGTLVMIYRSEMLGEILEATKGRFGNLCILPIHSRAQDSAKRIIVVAKAGSKAGMTILPGFVVHDENGQFSPLASAIFAGKGRLPIGKSKGVNSKQG